MGPLDSSEPETRAFCPSALSTLGLGVEPGPSGSAKLLLSREPGDASNPVSGSAGASPSRGRRTPKSSIDGDLAMKTTDPSGLKRHGSVEYPQYCPPGKPSNGTASRLDSSPPKPTSPDKSVESQYRDKVQHEMARMGLEPTTRGL